MTTHINIGHTNEQILDYSITTHSLSIYRASLFCMFIYCSVMSALSTHLNMLSTRYICNLMAFELSWIPFHRTNTIRNLIYPSIYLCIYLSIYLSIYPSIYLSRLPEGVTTVFLSMVRVTTCTLPDLSTHLIRGVYFILEQ